MKRFVLLAIPLLTILLLLAGCSSQESFRIQSLAKSEIDTVADTHLQTAESLMVALTRKLYARNPRELAKTPKVKLEDRITTLFGINRYLQKFDELAGKRSIDAMLLALNDDYQGDRVFALVAGLSTMIRASYENKEEFFMTDQLHEQKLYNSARNIEILAWRLQSRRNARSEPLLLTNATGRTVNLSFERLYGKLIANQDMMANLMSQKNQRAIRKTVQTIGRIAFLPI